MRRFVPYFLALMLSLVLAPAQPLPDEKPDASVAETKPVEEPENASKADNAEEESDLKRQADLETSEAIVERGKVRHRTEKSRKHRHHPDTPPYIRTDLTVKKGDTHGDVVIIDGNLRIEGEVDGNVVAIASKAFIDGPVRGSVIVVPGPVEFGPNAEIQDETVVVGESKRAPESTFRRGVQMVEVPKLVSVITGAKDFLFEGLLLMRPLPPSVRWVWFLHGAMLLVLIGMTLLFPKPVEVGAKAIGERPVVSIFSGFLTAILFIPVLLLLVVTVIGIVAVPFAFVGIILAALFGKASVLEFVGQQLGRNLRLAIFESPIIALIVGAAIIGLFYMVPVLGFLIWGVTTLLGLGAIMVATAAALNNQPTVPTPTGVPASPAVATAPVTISNDPAATAIAVSDAPVLLQRVGFWRRFFAAFLDWVLLAVPIGFSFAVLPGSFVLIVLVYFVGMWTWRGTTIGKICLGLKIVKIDGTPVDFATALVRSLSAFFSVLVAGIGYFWAGWDKEKQSWHDKIAGTVVVKAPRGTSLL